MLRIKPSGIDCVPEALKSSSIIIGWSEAEGLLDTSLSWEQFRQIFQDTYVYEDETYRGPGRDAGNMWRFIREMKEGDISVVPYGSEFYVAEVDGPAYYDPSKIKEDTAYRRKVKWLNGGKPIPRNICRAALQSRMKARQTCISASDLTKEIEEVLKIAKKGGRRTFADGLRRSLVETTLKEIRHGVMNERRFEELIRDILLSIGASEVRIIPRQKDKGADITATLSIADTFKFKLAVQAKYWKAEPPLGTEVVDKLVEGMKAEVASLGWVITSGTIPDEVYDYVKDINYQIELIDGEHLAALVVESGLKTL